ETAWQRMHRFKSLGAGVAPGVVPSPDDWQLSPYFDERASKEAEISATVSAQRKRFRLPLALAASLALAVVAAAWYLRPAEPSYRTPIGGLAAVPMTDGSKITLNTNSEIRVTLSDTERRIQLDRGEAFFEV